MSEKLHSTLGASSSKRWLNCPGSVALIEKAPPQPDSPWAKEGTIAHELMEARLNRLITDKAGRRQYGDEMADAVDVMQKEVFARMGPDSELLVEEKVDLSFLDPECFGTVDSAVVNLFGRLSVLDFKYGAGEVVEVKDNTQMIYYALGIAQLYDFNFSEIELVIVQPRARQNGKQVRTHIMTVEELQAYIPLFKKGIERTRQKDARLFADPSWCRFCAAKPICPAIFNSTLKKAAVVFDDLPSDEVKDLILPDPKDLSPDRIAKVLDGAKLLETWIKGLEEYALDFAQRGGEIPGYGVVPSKANRSWKDEKEAEIYLESLAEINDDFYAARKLKSPAKVAELIGDDAIEELVERVSSGFKLSKIKEIENGKEKSSKKSVKENDTKEKSEKPKKGRAKKEKGAKEIRVGNDDDSDYRFD